MAKPLLTGSRIRARRVDRGIRQAELARACGISPSYLNLIEHNRRKIGGALLNRIAKALDSDTAALSEGAESTLTTALSAAAERHPRSGAETQRTEEFAGRFPGWARLIEAQDREARRLEHVVEALNDRLSHDPFLSASMHEMLSSVTAIRSASAILAEGGEIEPEWQARFHRNILEDSQRLAQSTEALVRYLDAGGDAAKSVSLPQEEVEAWLSGEGWSIGRLEADPDADPGEVLAGASALGSPASREIARGLLAVYAADVRAVPRAALMAGIAGQGADPLALAGRFGVGLPVIFRRLSALAADDFPDREPRGLVICDGSGTLTFRKPVPGFDLPRYGAACALWPLFAALQRPMMPVRQMLSMAGREESRFAAHAFAETHYPAGFDGPPVTEASMLIEPRIGAIGDRILTVGTSCRICGRGDCPARREPSIVSGVRAGTPAL